MRHEMGHAAIAQGDISLDELRSAMLSDLSEKELGSAVEVYRHAYGDTISEAEAFEEMCCDALGKINIFAGTEHDSANYGKVQESFRKHTAETANKGRAPPKGGNTKSRVKYSNEYENANVNSDIITLANAVKSGNYDSNSYIELGTITKPIAQKIAKVMGIDFNSYKLKLEARQIRHIFVGHGENGTADHSMSNVRNLAKMQFAIEQATNVRYAGKTNAYTVYKNGKSRPADTVIYEKDIGAKSYYVVQTAVDTKKKTLYIVTAFIGEKGYKNGDTLSFDDKIPEVTPKSATASSPNTNIPTSNENVKKYSAEPTDAAYMKAVERGDTESAQRMVDEAAEEWGAVTEDWGGEPLVLYHATNSSFNVFDRAELGKRTLMNAAEWSLGATSLIGHWFSDHNVSKRMGTKRADRYYLKIENPYQTTLDDLAESIAEFGDEYEAMQTAFENAEFDSVYTAAEDFLDSLRSDGYDGLVVQDRELGGTSYVALDSEQIKSAEPITYDDNGNVIPLSERFKDNNPDIRYSREPESITELRRRNESLHNDEEKAAALYPGARVTVPKMPNKSNGYIQREFEKCADRIASAPYSLLKQ